MNLDLNYICTVLIFKKFSSIIDYCFLSILKLKTNKNKTREMFQWTKYMFKIQEFSTKRRNIMFKIKEFFTKRRKDVCSWDCEYSSSPLHCQKSPYFFCFYFHKGTSEATYSYFYFILASLSMQVLQLQVF